VIHVAPGLIRVASDELTYNQHILLRYEIEKGLMNGSISVDKLPKVRNEKMETYLGVVPDSDSDGCLQDVHRSLGLIGYFPTYMLGNIIGLQLRDRFVQDYPGWE
jgi:carboxypeptidase Taq